MNRPAQTTISQQKPWLRWGLRLAVLAAVGFGVHRSLLGGLGKLSDYRWQADPLWLALAGAIYLLALLPSALFWRQILRAMGQSAGFGETARAYYIGHLGKYVPGKALVVVMRAGLVGHGVDRIVAGASVFVETLTMMAVGSVFSAVVIPFWFPDRWPLIAAVAGLALLLGLPTLPPVFRRLAGRIPFLASDPLRAECFARLRTPTLAWGWAANLIGWPLAGLSMWAVMRALADGPVGTLASLPLYGAAVAVASVGGFLSMIPAGLFVREAILVELLAGDFGATAAVVGALVFRLVSLVAEVLVSVILYWAGPRPAAILAPPE